MARHSYKESVPYSDHENPLLKDYHSEVSEAQEAQERYQRQLQGDMKRLLATAEGRRFFKRLYGICKAGGISAALGNGGIDVNATFINMGRQAVWFDIQRMMDSEDLKTVLSTRGFTVTSEDDDDE